MKEIEAEAGEHIDRVCQKLAANAPAFCPEFNGVRIEAKPGDSAERLVKRWQQQMAANGAEYDRKRRAYDATPEGQAKIAAAKHAEEQRQELKAETLATISRTKVRERFPWPEPAELSGFGGGYEAACRDMVYAGMASLFPSDRETAATPSCGFDEIAMEKIVLAACPDCSGAMFGAAMGTLKFVCRNGWAKFFEDMTKRELARQ